MFVSVGLLLLTAVYLGVVGAFEHYFHSQCLGNGECFSEGVDNTILNWASDFFVALCLFFFASHLSFYASNTRDVRTSGILAQIFMGAAFLSNGVGNLLYPNSGIDDNHGMVGYWFVEILYVVFFTVSALAMSHFAVKSAERKFTSVVLFGGLLFLSMCGFLAGGVWCSLVPELQVIVGVDEFEPTDEVHACFKFMEISSLTMNFAYALLWLPVGLLLKVAARRDPVNFLGLPTPAAPIIAVVLQWSVGSMFVGALYVASLTVPGVDFFSVWIKIYGTVLYHWAYLLTFYCLHNLSYGLPWYFYENESEDESRKSDRRHRRRQDDRSLRSGSTRSSWRWKDGPTPLSWEWWVDGFTSMFPEPKKKKSKKKKNMKRQIKPQPYEHCYDNQFDDNSLLTSRPFYQGRDSDGRKQVTFVEVADV